MKARREENLASNCNRLSETTFPKKKILKVKSFVKNWSGKSGMNLVEPIILLRISKIQSYI